MSRRRGWLALVCLAFVALGVYAALVQIGVGLGGTGKGRPVLWNAYIASLEYFTGVGHGAAWVAAWLVLVRGERKGARRWNCTR